PSARGAAPGSKAGSEAPLSEKRRGLPALPKLQGPRRRSGLGPGPRVWLRYRLLLVYGKSGQLGCSVGGTQRIQGGDLHSCRPRARKNSRHTGFWSEVNTHSGKLRPGQSPVLPNCRRKKLGLRQREPSPLLCGRLENGRL